MCLFFRDEQKAAEAPVCLFFPQKQIGFWLRLKSIVHHSII